MFLTQYTLHILFALIPCGVIASPQSVAITGCAVVTETIFCYGGAATIANDGFPDLLSNQVVKMDLRNATPSWQMAQTNGFDLSQRFQLQMVPINNSQGFLAFGGQGPRYEDSSNLPTPSIIIYNVNEWKNVSTLSSDWKRGRYPLDSAMVDLSRINRTQVIFFGGNDYTIANNYTRVSIFDYAQNAWSLSPATWSTSLVRMMHTATLSSDGANIYILGGSYTYGLGVVNMTNVLIYSTTNAQWRTTIATSNDTLSERAYHTANSIPNSPLIFIYGGVRGGQPIAFRDGYTSVVPIIDGSKAALVYDTSANHFYYASIQGTSAPGPLIYHNSVSYTNSNGSSFVCILFGADQTFRTQSTAYFVNVTNTSKMMWVTTLINPSDDGSSSNGGNDSNKTESNQTSHLSAGATAGISLSVLVVAIGGCAALLFLYHRRRKAKLAKSVYKTDPRNQTDQEFFNKKALRTKPAAQSDDDKIKPFDIVPLH
ncbi:hypothetical protein BC940DRAFT_310319 [Gongronella butleri]|nr:hypothetical protein BC940DRAFT_310319 [Gongronella butleri]